MGYQLGRGRSHPALHRIGSPHRLAQAQSALPRSAHGCRSPAKILEPHPSGETGCQPLTHRRRGRARVHQHGRCSREAGGDTHLIAALLRAWIVAPTQTPCEHTLRIAHQLLLLGSRSTTPLLCTATMANQWLAHAATGGFYGEITTRGMIDTQR